MQRWYISGVQVEELPRVWHKIWPILEPATKRSTINAWTGATLRESLESKHSQLWIVFDRENNELVGACTTDLAIHNGETVLEVPLLAGQQFMAWGHILWAILTAWGAEQGAKTIAGFGRRGWVRVFGFTELGNNEDGELVMARPIGTSHG